MTSRVGRTKGGVPTYADAISDSTEESSGRSENTGSGGEAARGTRRRTGKTTRIATTSGAPTKTKASSAYIASLGASTENFI